MTISPKLIAELRGLLAKEQECLRALGDDSAKRPDEAVENYIAAARALNPALRAAVPALLDALDTRPDTNSAGMREVLEHVVRESAERLSIEAQLRDTGRDEGRLRAKMGFIAADLFQALAALNPDTPKVEG